MIDAGGLFSIVLPFRDQADHAGGVLRSFARELGAAIGRVEVIAVPNACSDATPEVVRALAAEVEGIRVVDNPAGGWGLSVLTGLRAATGETLCYTNSARTEPSQVVDLLRAYMEARPCLAKVRRVRRGVVAREVGSWLYNLEGRLLFGIGARDVNGTPKIFSRGDLDALALSSTGDLIDLELLAKAAARGMRVVELSVEGFRRHGGVSSTNWRSAWNMYRGALALRRSIREYRHGLRALPG